MAFQIKLWGLIFLLIPASVNADIIASYAAASDPTLQGWTFFGGPASSSTPVNDGGVVALNITDSGTSDGELLTYFHPLVESNFTNASGWLATAVVRTVYNPTQSFAGGVQFLIDDGISEYQIGISGGLGTVTSENGIYFVRPGNVGLSLIAQLDPTSNYHTYQISYSPSQSDRVSVFVDQTKVGEILRSQTLSTIGSPRIEFGSFSSRDVGSGNWNYVAFEISSVPEPSSFALLGMLICSIMLVRVRSPHSTKSA